MSLVRSVAATSAPAITGFRIAGTTAFALAEALEEWHAAWKAWESGADPARAKNDMPYWEWNGPPPDPAYYRPDWPEASRTHLMMYEDTSEGTPISPAFETPEELARWLADNNASAFAGMTATYEQWLATARGKWAPSMVLQGGVMKSGVEFSAERNTPPHKVSIPEG